MARSSSVDGSVAAPIVPDYQLIRRIGGGAYGEVWLARSMATGVLRAAKIVWRRTFDDDRPFQREFEGIQHFERISREHPSQLSLFHIGRNDAEGYFYYVMELADEVSEQLADESQNPKSDQNAPGISSEPPRGRFASEVESGSDSYRPHTLRADLEKGRLRASKVVEIGLALAEALSRLHGNGLVHRDVKPSNVIFVNGLPKLADIGLLTDASDTHSIVGTEGYLPPEGSGTVSADLFALGKVLYQATTGLDRREFPRLPEDLRGWTDAGQVFELNEIFLKACAPEATHRYKRADELAADLILLRAHVSIREKHALQRRLRFMKRTAIGAVAVMVLGAVPYYIAIEEARAARRDARRARLAEADSKEKLWHSYFAEAQAARFSGRAGRRSEAIGVLSKAAQIRTDLALRNETIACLALTDLRVGKVWNMALDCDCMMAFDAKYERYAVGCITNPMISVRRVADDVELLQLSGFTPPFGEICQFSPDGRLLAVSHDASRKLDIWDLELKTLVVSFPRDCRTLDFSPEGGLAAISFHKGSDANHSVIIYDLRARRISRVLDHGTLPYRICFRPHSNQLATSSEESSEAMIWDLESGKVVQRLHHPKQLAQIAWSPGGDLLATCCSDYQVYLWNVSKETPIHVLPGHSGFPREVSFSFDGKFLASRGWDGTLRFWDPWTGQQLFKQQVPGFTEGFRGASYRYGFHPGPRTVAFFELDPPRECSLFRIDASIVSQGQSCDFSPDGQLLLTAHEDGVRLWNPATGTVVAFHPQPDTTAAIFDAEGKAILLASPNGIQRWIFGENTHTVSLPSVSTIPARDLLFTQSRDVLGFTVNTNIYLLNTKTRSTTILRATKPLSRDPRLHPCLNPDGTLLAFGAGDFSDNRYPVKVFEVATTNLIRELPHSGKDDARPMFSPNGKWLLIGDNLEFQLWEVGSWKPLYTIPRGDAGYFAFMAFSPDSSTVAITARRDTVRLVDAVSGQELATLEAPEASDIFYLQFNPDGSQLAVMYRQGTVHIWDLGLIRGKLASMKLDWELPPRLNSGNTSAAR